MAKQKLWLNYKMEEAKDSPGAFEFFSFGNGDNFKYRLELFPVGSASFIKVSSDSITKELIDAFPEKEIGLWGEYHILIEPRLLPKFLDALMKCDSVDAANSRVSKVANAKKFRAKQYKINTTNQKRIQKKSFSFAHKV